MKSGERQVAPFGLEERRASGAESNVSTLTSCDRFAPRPRAL